MSQKPKPSLLQRGLFVDTGAWRGVLDRRDQFHGEARAHFERAAKDKRPLITSNLVIGEVQRLTLFDFGPVATRVAMRGVLGTQRLRLEFAGLAHHVRALSWIDELEDQDLSYTDACSFAIMTELGLKTVLGFDHHFRDAGFHLAGDEE